ncbi:MAG TPA: hypothetical protein VJK04_00125 [Candidatus Paceibacterota bacterium]
MKNFSLKFIDIMVGIVLGLGFQWWPNLQTPWQYIAFIFVYLDIVDYWIDYSPSLKKFPPKKEINVMLDVSIMFALFLYIYSTQLTIIYFLTAFVVFIALDYFWLLSSRHEYHPTGTDKLFVDTWIRFNLVEIFIAIALIILVMVFHVLPLAVLIIFIVARLITRALASWRYKKVHFA